MTKNLLFYYVFAITISVYSIFLSVNYNVGTDFSTYINWIRNIQTDANHKEFGFVILSQILVEFFSPTAVLNIFRIIYLVLIGIIAMRSPYPTTFFVLSLFSPNMILASLNALQNSISVGFFILLVTSYETNRSIRIRHLMSAVGSLSFHVMGLLSVIYTVIIIVLRLFPNLQKYYLVWLVIGLTTVISVTYYLESILNFVGLLRYLKSLGADTLNITILIMFAVSFGLALLILRELKLKIILAMYIPLAIIIYVIEVPYDLSIRVLNYFYPLLIFYFLAVIRQLKIFNNWNKVIILISLSVIMIAYFSNSLKDAGAHNLHISDFISAIGV